MTGKVVAAGIIVFLGCLILLQFMAGFLVDWLWFSSIGYNTVFWTMIGAKVGLVIVVFAASALAICGNGYLARRLSERSGYFLETASPGSCHDQPELSQLPLRLRPFIAVAPVIAAALVALAESANWSVALRFLPAAIKYALSFLRPWFGPAVRLPLAPASSETGRAIIDALKELNLID